MAFQVGVRPCLRADPCRLPGDRGAYPLLEWCRCHRLLATLRIALLGDLIPSFVGRSLPTLQEPTVDDEIQLISDGDGLAVIGSPTAVERFLISEGLPSKDLGLPGSGLSSVPGLQPHGQVPRLRPTRVAG